MNKKGFSLVEIVVVVTMVSILAVIAFVSYSNLIWQGKVQAVEHNLMAIAVGEQKYNEDHGSYYISLTGDDFYNINSNLSLSMGVANDGFTYTCASSPSPYTCSATNLSAPPSGYTYIVNVSSSGNLTCSYNAATVTCP